MTAPPPDPGAAGLDAALAAVASTPRLLACWDFDGTLAPIVRDPEAARPLPGAVPLLVDLAGQAATSVALLSGRSRADLARLSGAGDPVVLVGSHGAELPDHLAGELEVPADRLDDLVVAVTRICTGVPGVLLETKPVSVAVHVRQASRADAARITDEVLAGPAHLPGVHVTRGKEVVELSVVRVDKGAAIESLRAAHDATAVVFVGDDVTDERGFAVLGPADVGVKVGDGESLARYRVGSPADVMILLRELVELRRSLGG